MVDVRTGLTTADKHQMHIINALQQWAVDVAVEMGLGTSKVLASWQALNGDAGFRRYFRFALAAEPQVSLLAVWSPPALEKNNEFVRIAQFIRGLEVAVPTVYGFDERRGFLLVEDLGPDLLLSHLSPIQANALYQQALQALLQLQSGCPEIGLVADYDEAMLLREMALFADWFVGQLLGVELSDDDTRLLQQTFESLANSALAQPKVFVHRDFHSRNLVYRPAQVPGVIDFQDAVMGPITYDLVSLLRDCYIVWPQDRVFHWVQEYLQGARERGLVAEDVTSACFFRWFDWMGLQRHIKVLGIFARLWLRDGKSRYLQNLPAVVTYVRTVSAGYPELSAFNRWFDQRLMGRIRQQTWMIDD